MQLTIGIWIIPVILTGVVLFWPVDTGSDHYGAGSLLVAGGKLIALLFIWLVFFAASYAFS